MDVNVIAQSWRRSELSGVDPTRLDPPQVDVNTDTVLVRTVREVLSPTLHHLADSGMTVGLTDADGRVVWRWAENNHILGLMDESRVAVGFDFSEENVGTNGAGTVLESGMPVMIGGGEHYVEELKRFACFAAPVVHPVTGHRMGVLSLSCEAGRETPLMRAMVLQYAAHIGQALLATQTESRKLLLDQFADAARVRRTPVIAVSPDVLICDRKAARLQLDHQTLWDHVRDFTSEGDIVVPTSDGIVARVEPMLIQGQMIGSIIVLRSEPGVRPASNRDAVGTTHQDVSWSGLTQRITATLGSAGRFLLWGEPSTGKTTMLREVLDLDGGDVFDLDSSTGSSAEQVRRLRGALQRRPRRLGLLHIDRISRHVAGEVAEVLAQARSAASCSVRHPRSTRGRRSPTARSQRTSTVSRSRSSRCGNGATSWLATSLPSQGLCSPTVLVPSAKTPSVPCARVCGPTTTTSSTG